MNVDCNVVGGNQSTEPIFLSIERHINCDYIFNRKMTVISQIHVIEEKASIETGT